MPKGSKGRERRRAAKQAYRAAHPETVPREPKYRWDDALYDYVEVEDEDDLEASPMPTENSRNDSLLIFAVLCLVSLLMLFVLIKADLGLSPEAVEFGKTLCLLISGFNAIGFIIFLFDFD